MPAPQTKPIQTQTKATPGHVCQSHACNPIISTAPRPHDPLLPSMATHPHPHPRAHTHKHTRAHALTGRCTPWPPPAPRPAPRPARPPPRAWRRPPGTVQADGGEERREGCGQFVSGPSLSKTGITAGVRVGDVYAGCASGTAQGHAPQHREPVATRPGGSVVLPQQHTNTHVLPHILFLPPCRWHR